MISGAAPWCRRALLVLLVGLPLSTLADGVVSEAVEVKGLVAATVTLAVADLKKLEAHDVALPGEGGAKRSYRGVLLRDLLTAARPVEATRFDLRRNYVVARATDGYVAVFSWMELFNSAIGDQVLVAYAVDGGPLGDAEGRIALISGADTRGGPRHVRWLSSIDVLRITS